MINEYFKTLFSSQTHLDDQKKAIVLRSLSPSITDSANQELIKDPSPAEIKEVMFAVHPDKAPETDGFSSSFFQTNWSIVGPYVI